MRSSCRAQPIAPARWLPNSRAACARASASLRPSRIKLVDAHVEVELEFVVDVRAHVVTGASGEGKQPLNPTQSHASSSPDA